VRTKNTALWFDKLASVGQVGRVVKPFSVHIEFVACAELPRWTRDFAMYLGVIAEPHM
jgi:hypothetical protein